MEGAGPEAVVLLHPLTATREGVLHGSRRLARGGAKVVRYDARGHGSSAAAAPGAGYTYPELVADLERVVAAADLDRPPILIGSSMGAHTAAAAAIRNPDGYAGLVLIGPASTGSPPTDEDLARWDSLAGSLEGGGVEAFVEASLGSVADQAPAVLSRLRSAAVGRMERHEDLAGVARALREVPRSRPFEGLGALSELSCPVIVIGSRDDLDPRHPLAVARQWAAAIDGAALEVEADGESPIAWRGHAVAEIAARLLEE